MAYNNEKVHIRMAFILLHYMNEALTSRAVESILELKGVDDCRIVVVDNASSNGSGEKLRNKYESEIIHVIICNENGGFSKGNNVGYRYVKDNYDSEFIVAANNDVLFPNAGFIEEISNLYKRSPFNVGGWMCMCLTGICIRTLSNIQYRSSA
ncbi:MAG: glycosyltransferase [Lachnospiraceae bacterium]|nr:glycosyltransferase [Lachnospiraceae bacterium]